MKPANTNIIAAAERWLRFLCGATPAADQKCIFVRDCLQVPGILAEKAQCSWQVLVVHVLVGQRGN